MELFATMEQGKHKLSDHRESLDNCMYKIRGGGGGGGGGEEEEKKKKKKQKQPQNILLKCTHHSLHTIHSRERIGCSIKHHKNIYTHLLLI